MTRNSPGGPVVKNPPSNAGVTGLITDRGTKIPHAAGQLSPLATTIELARLNVRARVLQTTEPMRSAALMPQLDRSPHATTREKPEHRNEETTHCNKRSHIPQRRSHVLQLRSNAAKK